MRKSHRPSSPVTAGDLLAVIRSHDGLTRADIAARTGLSRTAVTSRIAALQDRNLVTEVEDGVSTGGRPPTTLAFNVDAGVVLAAAIGRSRVQLAVCDLAAGVLAVDGLEQNTDVGPHTVVPLAAERLTQLLASLDRRPAEVLGVGVSIPGTVDAERGCSRSALMMPGWDGVELAPFFAELTDAPVLVDNDTNVMVLAEGHGRLGKCNDLLLLKASTGLGAGIRAGGALQRGALGAAGEIGHTKTVAADGMPCRCGETGCVEAVAGGWALVQQLRARGREVAHVRDVVTLSLEGDSEARRLIRTAGRHIGEVLAGAVNLLNPAVVVVGGDMAPAYDDFVAGVRETLYGGAIAVATRGLEILPTEFGDRSGVIGSATLAVDHVLSPASVDRDLSKR